jgi:Trypsin-like peptidase domain
VTGDSTAYPPSSTWIAAIHRSEHDLEPIGTAVVIDFDQVLTCAHVVTSEGAVRRSLWVAFPQADERPRRRVAGVTLSYNPPVKDLALLALEQPVPDGVETAPLRCPKPGDMVSGSWWAFGFPGYDPVGNSAGGQIGTALGDGWVRLDTGSRYLVEPGFSGGGLWSADYKAVVAVVGQAHANGDGRAITLHQADLCFPGRNIAALAARWSAETAGEAALHQWGWTLARDPEGIRHWIPLARGVSIESERGYRFRGRTAALTAIVQWLGRTLPDRKALVVTGSPGVGKSAVLGRIVTTSDPAIWASLPPNDDAVRATSGSISCAVHAKAKTAMEVAEEIARAASARLPEDTSDMAPAVRDVLSEHAGRRFNVLIDALDEASSPAQVRAIIDHVMLPLVETCSDVGAQVIVGTRRRDDDGNLLVRFGAALSVIDLDDPEYFAEDDLAAYALACLQLAGDERPGNPYADDTSAAMLADRIAAMSGRNFLVAGLTARTHGLHDEEPAIPQRLGFTSTVDSALAAYIQRLSPAAGLSADHALTALAFAEAPGLPVQLWQLAVQVLYGTDVSVDDLARFARSAAANFLVEVGEEDPVGPGTGPVYQLFHQALNDALLRSRADVSPRGADERALTAAFIRHGRASKWAGAPA